MSEIDKIIETLKPYKSLDDYADSYLLPQEKRYLNSIGVNRLIHLLVNGLNSATYIKRC